MGRVTSPQQIFKSPTGLISKLHGPKPKSPQRKDPGVYERRSSTDGHVVTDNTPPSSRPDSSSETIRQGAVAVQRIFDTARRSAFSKPITMDDRKIKDEKVAELADIIRTYRGVEAEETDQKVYPWYEGPKFDVSMCFVILLNVFVIGLETDLGDSSKTGYDRAPIWITLEWIFCLIFVWEVIVKIRYNTLAWFSSDPWSWLTLAIALMAFVDIAILSPLKISGLRMLSLVRIINLLRLKKVIEHNKMLKELKLVMRGMVGSAASLFWSVVVLMLIMFVFSVWTTSLIGLRSGYAEHSLLSNGWDNEKFFGSLGKSMFSMLQVMSLDTWCSGIVRHVAHQQWWMIALFSTFIMLTTYGIMNLIVSIIVEHTLEASQHSETRCKAREERQQKAELESVKDIFLLADADGNGDLTLSEYNAAVKEDNEVMWRLRQLELPEEDVRRLFQTIDGDGSRTLGMKEFVEGCTKLKGPARSKELLALQHQADSMSKQMDRLAMELRDTEIMLSRLDSTTRRMTNRFGPSVLHSRRKIEERVRGAAPNKPLPPEKNGSLESGHLQAGNNPRLPNFPNLVD